MERFVLAVATFTVLLLATSGETQEKESFPVTLDVASSKPDADGKQKVAVTLTIRKGYYTFANPVEHKDLEASRPILRIEGKNVAKDAVVIYPMGELVKDQIVGDYRIYKDTVKLEAIVQRQNYEPEPLTVTVRLRPYDNRGCLWGTRELTKTVR